MAKGGFRPGAGRKPRPVKFAGEIAKAEQWIADRLPFLLEGMYKLASGGDRQALEYLINRVMGRPVERVEVEETPSVDLTKLDDKDLEDLDRIQSKLYSEPAGSSEPSGD